MNFQYCKKTSFATEQDALFFIEKIKKDSKRKKRPKSAYLCKKCGHWHLTSQEQRGEKAISELKKQISSLKQENERLEKIVAKHNSSTTENIKDENSRLKKKIKRLNAELTDIRRRIGMFISTDTTYKWLEVKKYLFKGETSWEKKFRTLEEHHLEEINFYEQKLKKYEDG